MPTPIEANAFVASEEDLGLRIMAGFVAREGLGHDEAERLTWGDLDLEHGIVRLDENKTDDPRSWALRHVAQVLRAWYLGRDEPGDGEPLFVDEDGEHLRVTAADLRAAYRAADLERGEMHDVGPATLPSGFHALRGLFVADALARGKSETWALLAAELATPAEWGGRFRQRFQVVGHEGLEPSANGLRVHCSTN